MFLLQWHWNSGGNDRKLPNVCIEARHWPVVITSINASRGDSWRRLIWLNIAIGDCQGRKEARGGTCFIVFLFRDVVLEKMCHKQFQICADATPLTTSSSPRACSRLVVCHPILCRAVCCYGRCEISRQILPYMHMCVCPKFRVSHEFYSILNIHLAICQILWIICTKFNFGWAPPQTPLMECTALQQTP